MIWTKQYHALDLAFALREQAVGSSRDITGIDVPGMRGDHCFGLKTRRRGARETAVDTRCKFIRIARIEKTSDARRLHVCAHVQSLRNRRQSPSLCEN
jgi:hypothetical protein